MFSGLLTRDVYFRACGNIRFGSTNRKTHAHKHKNTHTHTQTHTHTHSARTRKLTLTRTVIRFPDFRFTVRVNKTHTHVRTHTQTQTNTKASGFLTRAVYDALRKPLGYTVTLEPPYAQSCVRACATLCHRQCQHILLSVFLCFPLFPCVSFCFLVFPFVFLCFPLFPFVSLLFSFVFLVFLFVSFCFLLFPFVSLCSPPKHIPLGLCVFPGPDLKPQRTTSEAYRYRASALALESHQTHMHTCRDRQYAHDTLLFRLFDPNRIFQRARACRNIRFGSKKRNTKSSSF